MAYVHKNYIYNKQLSAEENLLLDRLFKLRLSHMSEALEKQFLNPNTALEDFHTRISEIINYEWDQRQTTKFNKLLKKNSDVAGWIYCPDTVVNYPVMHGEDNELYLHHMVNKEYNFAGCIFEDYRNTRGQKDPATILYGHHMKDGSMFAMLHDYTDQKYYDKHPTMWYLTPTQNYRLDLIMGYVAGEKDPVYSLFETPKQMQDYLRSVKEKSTFKPKVTYDIDSLYNIIVLSTCAYEFQNARFLVIAVPIPIQ